MDGLPVTVVPGHVKEVSSPVLGQDVGKVLRLAEEGHSPLRQLSIGRLAQLAEALDAGYVGPVGVVSALGLPALFQPGAGSDNSEDSILAACSKALTFGGNRKLLDDAGV